MSSFIPSSTQNLFKFATWIYFITHINMWVFWSWYILKFSSFLVFYRCLYLEKMWPGKNVKVYDIIIFLIKFSSEFLQFFYSDSLYHTYQCVVITSWYIFNNFLHFCMFFRYFYLEKYHLGSLIRITSNSLHGYIVSYPSICLWFRVDIIIIFLHFGVFFSVFI